MRPFRIPLIGPYDSRMTVTSNTGASGYVGVGIVGVMIVGQGYTPTDKGSRYVNVFAQTINDQITGKKRVFAVKRPGFGTQSTPALGQTGHSILVWTGSGSGLDVISAFGATNSTIYNATSSLGAITGKSTGISETTVNTTATLVVSSSDNTGWYYDTGVGVMTKITDGDFPGNGGETLAGTFVHLDGFAIVHTTRGRLWASDINSVTAWTANSFGSTNHYPDKGVASLRHKSYVMAFGSESVEFWRNAGLTPFPLARVNDMTIKVGATSADAIAQIADTVFWVGSTPQGGLSVFQYDGNLSRISTPEIDAALLLVGASGLSLTTLRAFGRSFVLLKAGTYSQAYCIEEKFWAEWSSTNPVWYKCVGLSMGGTMVNYAVSNTLTTGKVYQMNSASPVFTDDSVAYTARIQLPLQDFGTKRTKFYSDVELVGDVETSASTINLLYSDDDYASYVTHGASDLSNSRVRFTRLGSSRRRAWVLTHAANTPMRLEALEGNVSIGNS